MLNRAEHTRHLEAQSIKKERSRVSVLSSPHFMGAVIAEVGGKMDAGHSNCKEAKRSPSPNAQETGQVADTFVQVEMQTTRQGQLPFPIACESKASFSESTGEKTRFHIKTEFETDKLIFSPSEVLQGDLLHVHAVPI